MKFLWKMKDMLFVRLYVDEIIVDEIILKCNQSKLGNFTSSPLAL